VRETWRSHHGTESWENPIHRHLQIIAAALTAAGLSAGIGVSASAADLPPAYAKAPIAPAYNWTGCYLGVHAGGGIIGTSFADNTTSSTDGGGGALAGGQAGCNYQAGQFIFGLEGEGAWSGITDRFHEIIRGFSTTLTGRNRWDADLALRVGFAVDRTFVYGKAGAALGSFEFTDIEIPSHSSHGQSTLSGLLLGAGVEYAFASNWTAKLEYNVIDFAAKDTSFTSSDGPFTESESAKKQIVKVGVNYRFGN
jgi:outer membrane immunogenic protein